MDTVMADGLADGLVMYVLYEKPDDYPDYFVVRMHTAIEGKSVPNKELFAKCDSLKEAIESIPKGLVFCRRDDSDPKSVVGTWL